MAKVLDPQTRIDDLLFIASHLVELLEQENVALAHNRIDVIHELVDQKVKLSRAYEIRVLGLEKSPNSLDGIDEAQIEELKRYGDQIEELIEVNAKELSINIDVGNRFMAVLTESVKVATPSAGTYDSTGSAGMNASSRNKQIASLAINKQL